MPYRPYNGGESWECERTTEDVLYERAWILGYALTYKHDSRPLILANGGFNRVEINRDAAEIPRWARYIKSCDATWLATRHLPPWEQARTMCRTEARTLGYGSKRLKDLLTWLDELERFERSLGVARKRAVTNQTLDQLSQKLHESLRRKGVR